MYGGKKVSFNIEIKEPKKSNNYNEKNLKILSNEEVKNNENSKYDDPFLLELIIFLIIIVGYIIIKNKTKE